MSLVEELRSIDPNQCFDKCCFLCCVAVNCCACFFWWWSGSFTAVWLLTVVRVFLGSGFFPLLCRGAKLRGPKDHCMWWVVACLEQCFFSAVVSILIEATSLTGFPTVCFSLPPAQTTRSSRLIPPRPHTVHR